MQAVQKADFKDWNPGKPILVFIHGTASSTLGSFGVLSETCSTRDSRGNGPSEPLATVELVASIDRLYTEERKPDYHHPSIGLINLRP